MPKGPRERRGPQQRSHLFLYSCLKGGFEAGEHEVLSLSLEAQTQPALLMLAAQLWLRGLFSLCPKQELSKPEQWHNCPQEPVCDLRELLRKPLIWGDVHIQTLPRALPETSKAAHAHAVLLHSLLSHVVLDSYHVNTETTT